MRNRFDRSGLGFVVLLVALVAIVMSIALFRTTEPQMQPADGSLIPPTQQNPQQLSP